jgi:hypothetical protein
MEIMAEKPVYRKKNQKSNFSYDYIPTPSEFFYAITSDILMS